MGVAVSHKNRYDPPPRTSNANTQYSSQIRIISDTLFKWVLSNEKDQFVLVS